jgi:hypothetical protein
VQNWRLGIGNLLGNACRVDQDIRSTIFLQNGLHATLNGTSITDIDLEEIDWDGGTGLLVEFSSRDVAELLVGIEQDHVLAPASMHAFAIEFPRPRAPL